MTDVDQFLMGGKRNSAKFPTVGTMVKGVVLSKTMEQQRDFDSGQPKFWDDEPDRPMMQAVIELQTDERDPGIDADDGRRFLFAKGAMTVAIRDAVKKAGKTALELGDELAVKYTGDGEAKRRGLKPPKQFTAWVKQGTPPPAPVDLDSDMAPF